MLVLSVYLSIINVSFLFFAFLFLHNVPIPRNIRNTNDTDVIVIIIMPRVEISSFFLRGIITVGRLTLNTSKNNVNVGLIKALLAGR